MTTTVSQEAVEVTQADREAVAEFHRQSFKTLFTTTDADIDAGINRSYELLCQAFARHRQSAERGEVVAWLHTLHMEGGQTYTKLTDWDCVDPDEPDWTAFGKPGRDYSEEYIVTSQPLYTLPTPPEAA